MKNLLLCAALLSVLSAPAFASISAGSLSAASQRYVIQTSSVYDKETDLTWARCSVGQRWQDMVGCEGKIKTFSFDNAQLQGGNGWRVPSKYELETLIDPSRQAQKQFPVIDVVAFPNMEMQHLWYWTSTSDSNSFGFAVFFYDHYVDSGSRNFTVAVRLVHSGQ